MGAHKRWLENLSVRMGFGGEINDAVLGAAPDAMGEEIDREKDRRFDVWLSKQNLPRGNGKGDHQRDPPDGTSGKDSEKDGGGIR
jgi:hypothetical protein